MKKKNVTLLLALLTLQMTACGNGTVTELKTTEVNETEIYKETEPQEIKDVELDEEGESEQGDSFVEGQDFAASKLNSFGQDLFRKSLDTKNPILSPLSVYLALNMVAEGANGNTKTQLEEVLGSRKQQEAVSNLARKELVKNTEGMTFSINDSIWVDDLFETNQDWVNKVMAYEGNKAFLVKLEDPSVVGSMNKWIEDSTHGLIKEMIKEPFTEDDRMVLFDAIYMKGKWCLPFEVFGTYEEDFTLTDQSKIQVPTMHMDGEKFDYFSNDSLEGMVMPYQDSSLAYVAIRAKNNVNIKDVLKNTKEEEIWSLLENRSTKSLNIKLPKYDITAELDLTNLLQDLGITDAFSQELADFSDLGASKDGENVSISMVKQNARVKVDEEGTEAAAVTEIVMSCKSAMMEQEVPYDLFFQEPFYYMIVDMDQRIPVFMGVLDHPVANNYNN